MNWPREPAPAYLNNMLAKFKDARFIPFRLTDGVIRANDEEVSCSCLRHNVVCSGFCAQADIDRPGRVSYAVS